MRKFKLTLATILCGISLVSFGQTDFKLDPVHTLIQFNVERFMVGEVTGAFTEYEGSVKLDDSNSLAVAQVTIKANSLDTNNETRDGHLTGPRWLNAAEYSEISFKSTEIYKRDGKNMIKGNLTIKGVTQEVNFSYEMKGPFKDPTGVVTLGLTGDLTINRQDYGINFSKVMDNGEMFIGNDVIIKIRALALLK